MFSQIIKSVNGNQKTVSKDSKTNENKALKSNTREMSEFK